MISGKIVLKALIRLEHKEGDMKLVRVRSYLQSGEFTTCEHLYAVGNQQKALDRFRRDYPEHKECILVAEEYDSDDPKNAEHFKACSESGCVHYW